MTDYREIIRLHSLKFSNVAIANSLCCSRNTVSEVLKLAETHSLEWPIPETLTIVVQLSRQKSKLFIMN